VAVDYQSYAHMALGPDDPRTMRVDS
jgi:hypothetical protein